MRIKFGIFILLIVFASLYFVKDYAVNQQKVISTWIWDGRADVDLQFAKKNDVNQLYYYIEKDINFEQVSSVIKRANEMDMEVYALQGDPTWIYENGEVVEWLSSVKEYNEQSAFPFAGIVFDVEPYLLPEWDRDAKSISVQFLSFIRKIESMETELPIKWTVPFWFDNIPGENGLSLAEAIFKETNGIIIMAYRNKLFGQDGLLKHIEAEIEWSKKYKTSLIVAVETRKSEVEKISFYGKGKDQFYSSMKKLQETLKQEKYIEGISIHYLDTWKALVNGNEPANQ
ncbi:hypothetical protein [Priestia abyssalis]|uniref:hypothetical protein n=1 Tax=Priestia abyssalis TaxID=1221450 RepID=UPI001115D058|nr:hypothetical protein [Priestia abyssalis]